MTLTLADKLKFVRRCALLGIFDNSSKVGRSLCHIGGVSVV